jgi:hypothetical protein
MDTYPEDLPLLKGSPELPYSSSQIVNYRDALACSCFHLITISHTQAKERKPRMNHNACYARPLSAHARNSSKEKFPSQITQKNAPPHACIRPFHERKKDDQFYAKYDFHNTPSKSSSCSGVKYCSKLVYLKFRGGRGDEPSDP